MINVVLMTIQWSVASFTGYLLGFMNKYFEGSIFLNYYLDSASGIVGALLALVLFKYLRMRWSYIISLSIALLGGVWLLIFQQDYLSSSWVGAF